MSDWDDPKEDKLLLELHRASSRLQVLALEPIQFLEQYPDQEFKDESYFKRQKALTDEIESIITKLNERHRERNSGVR